MYHTKISTKKLMRILYTKPGTHKIWITCGELRYEMYAYTKYDFIFLYDLMDTMVLTKKNWYTLKEFKLKFKNVRWIHESL